MEPFRTVTSVAAPLIEDDINTGEIAPGAGGGLGDVDFAALFFGRRRRDVDGREIPGFVLNEDRYRHTQILVAGGNFGCGSSSESSVWVPVAFGIRCIVARSFADIYRENCLKNGILPVVLGPDAAPSFESAVLRIDGSEPFTVDLVEQQISGAGGQWAFEVSPGERQALVEGLDPIGLSLRHADGIAAFEQKTADSWPWLANLTRSA
jgi:3-isopropylmalate/(R)-2-methylmalate dehydratase small subunit